MKSWIVFIVVAFISVGLILHTKHQSTKESGAGDKNWQDRATSGQFVPTEPSTSSSGNSNQSIRKVAEVGAPRPLTSVSDLEARYNAKVRAKKGKNGLREIIGQIPLEVRPGESRQKVMTNFLIEVAPLLGVKNPDTTLSSAQITSDDALGKSYTFHQHYKGIPVEGAFVDINENKIGEVFLVTNNWVDLKTIDTVPRLTKRQATEISIRHAESVLAGKSVARATRPELFIHKSNSGNYDLTWALNITQEAGPLGRATYYINAHTGDVERVNRVEF